MLEMMRDHLAAHGPQRLLEEAIKNNNILQIILNDPELNAAVMGKQPAGRKGKASADAEDAPPPPPKTAGDELAAETDVAGFVEKEVFDEYVCASDSLARGGRRHPADVSEVRPHGSTQVSRATA